MVVNFYMKSPAAGNRACDIQLRGLLTQVCAHCTEQLDACHTWRVHQNRSAHRSVGGEGLVLLQELN